MADETTPATDAADAAVEQPATEQPTTDAQPQQPDPREQEIANLRAGYASLQRKYETTLQRANASTTLMSEMGENLRLLRESNVALTKSTMGEEQAAALDKRFTESQQDAQRKQAASAAMEFVTAQTRLFNNTLSQFGIDPSTIKWPQGQMAVGEWFDQADAAVRTAVAGAREKYVKAVESASAKAKEAAKADAEKLADKELAKAGVGKIDNARGTANLRDRLASMDPKSPEFAQMVEQAKRGQLTKL